MNIPKGWLVKGAIAGILILAFSTGWSATATYFDRSAFLTASASLPGIKQHVLFYEYRDENFFTTQQYGAERAAITIDGVRFQGRYLRLGPAGLWNYDSDEVITVSCSSGARAFAAYFSSDTGGLSSNFTATVTMNGKEQFVFNALAAPNSTFFGVVSDTVITNLTFSDGGAFFGMGEEQISTVYMVLNSIPVPSLQILVQPEFQYVSLRWPATSPGFLVQENVSGSWGSQIGTRLLGGTNCYVPLTQSKDARFYRLVLDTGWW